MVSQILASTQTRLKVLDLVLGKSQIKIRIKIKNDSLCLSQQQRECEQKK